MSLSDVISGTGLSTWQTIALVIFAAAFVAIVVHTLLRSRADVQRAARLPIEERALSTDEPVDSNATGKRAIP